jgi:hypothetical protein
MSFGVILVGELGFLGKKEVLTKASTIISLKI